ncbi:hypothetical protein WB904_004166 [Vibrio parahaemolyticus]
MFDKQEILERAKVWFTEYVATNHIKNTEKLVNPKEFDINPFSAIYLANFLTGDSSPQSIAKALLLPRVLGTSFNTSFGMGIQKFTNEVLGAYGSTTAGIDIEFEDKIDGFRKYCQVKLGPNTINKDDVETIAGHFKGVINLARTNNLRVTHDDLIVGVIWGEPQMLSSHYKRISKQYDFPVLIGQEFWHRLTGDPDFYQDLIATIGSVAIESDFSSELENIVEELASTDEIKKFSSNHE